MPPALRRAQILERIQRDGGVSVADLARDHAVSLITVHRDLEQLSREGLVERVHGGARALRGTLPVIATAWTQRVEQEAAAKAAIAAHVATMVTSGSTVFLDASSTALALARRLMEDPPNELTLVTNSPAIAYEVIAEPMHVVVCPGELDQHMRMIAGRWTVEFLHELNFDMAFVSAAGLTIDAGLTTSRRPLADVVNAAQGGCGQDGGDDRRDQVRAGVTGVDRARAGAGTDRDRRRLGGGRRGGIPSSRGAAGDRREVGRDELDGMTRNAVHRPVGRPGTEELAGKCAAWGFDGLELACWGDHFDVAEATRDSSYAAGQRELLERHGVGRW